MRTLTVALCSGAALTVLAHASAQAQSTLPPPDVQEAQAAPTAETTAQGDIVVTGSRIRRDPLSQDAPIVFLDQEDMKKTGLNSTSDILQRLPSAGGGLNSKFNNSGNLGNPPDGGGVGAGSAEIDLRYLGSRRVLVLVDGLRYVNGASASGVPGSTDLNSIPESSIERIEVLQDGASAIYGSDAIAGVVNIITKRRQQGFVASAQLGKYLDEGDGFTQNYQLSWGNGSDGPTQVVLGGNFVKQGGVFAGDRAISAFPAPFSSSCADGGCSGYLPMGRFFFGPDDLTLDGPIIGRPTTPDDFRPRVTPQDTFNFAPFNYVQIPVERLGLFVNFRHEFSDAVNFSLKGIWNRRVSKNQAAPLPLGIGPGAGNGNFLDTISIDATNPFNPFGVDLLTSDTEDAILRRMVELGPRRFEQTVKTYYWVASLDGRFTFLNSDWFWDLNASYGRNEADQIFLGNINGEKLAQALGPISQCQAPCVPFNIFGGAGTITEEMLGFVGFREHDRSKQTQYDYTGNLSGKLFDLPGGPLGIALGLEYRDLDGSFDPDPVVAAGFGADIPAQPTAGGYNVKEAYVELNAPILADRPFFELLEFDGAMRWSDYSTSGSTTTFKAGVNWKPIADLRLRGSWSEGFRAPTIGELFGSQTRFDQSLEDPCSSHATNEAPRNFQNDPAVRQNCITLGIPADGSYEQANPQLSVLTGGNEDLIPETSKGWVIGAVYSPGFLPRFSIETNYYKIKIDDAIQAVGASTTLNACIFNLDPTACALVSRLSNGQVTQIRGLLQNIASIETDGLDLNLAYRTPNVSWGQFAFTWNNSFLFNYHETVPTATGTDTIKREGTERGSPDQAYPKWKSIGIIDWNGYDFGATLTGRYIKAVEEVDADNKLGSRFYTDIQLRWEPKLNWLQDLGLAVGVNNLFDKDPPGCISCSINNFDPTTYDVPGRYYYARVSAQL